MKAKKTYNAPLVEIIEMCKLSFLDTSLNTGETKSSGDASQSASQGKKSYSSPIWSSEE